MNQKGSLKGLKTSIDAADEDVRAAATAARPGAHRRPLPRGFAGVPFDTSILGGQR